MKMRTLGRHHRLLKILSDGELKIHRELKASQDAYTLQTLLIRGLVNRLPEDTNMRGWYLINSAGRKAYEKLEEVQSISLDHTIACYGYRWVEVECPMNSYWIEYFKTHVW